MLAIDGTIVVDCMGFGTRLADFGDCVGRCLLESLNDAVHDIDEDDFVAGIVKKFADETSACLSGISVFG